jgi:tRNA(Ile)-lysidine synthase
VALAVLCAALVHRRTPPPIIPFIAHVDHQLRPESAAEAESVRQLASLLDVPFLHRAVSVKPSGQGVSAAAREARYAALEAMASEVNASIVATAHHVGDQAETLLLAMARGTGVQGVLGMLPTRDLGRGIQLVRPLLSASREDLRELLEQSNVSWVEDPGNDDLDSPRACIRHEILPRLEALYPGATRHIAGLPDAIRPEICTQADAPAVRWSRTSLAELEPSSRRAIVRRSAIELDPSVQATPRRTWDAVAVAIASEALEVRRHVLSDTLQVVVDSKEVVLRYEPIA